MGILGFQILRMGFILGKTSRGILRYSKIIKSTHEIWEIVQNILEFYFYISNTPLPLTSCPETLMFPTDVSITFFQLPKISFCVANVHFILMLSDQSTPLCCKCPGVKLQTICKLPTIVINSVFLCRKFDRQGVCWKVPWVDSRRSFCLGLEAIFTAGVVVESSDFCWKWMIER